MPVVSIKPENYEKFDLETAEGAYVMLRPLPYGIKLARRSKATRMMMHQKATNSRKQAQQQDSVFEVETHDEWAVAHDFVYCIGDHNLEIEEGVPYDFSDEKTARQALRSLDPKVGAEIERLIDSLNNEEGEESIEDFLLRSDTSSEGKKELSKTDGNDE